MADIRISVINSSTVLTDAEVDSAVACLQTQVTRDFAPAWGIDAELVSVKKGGRPLANTWWLVVLDDSDQAGALGYHDLTDKGLPIGKVFAGSDMKAGFHWTVTASHELLEMLGDPDINLTVFVQSDPRTGVLYAYEVCDAVEADRFGYEIDGQLVSDFVYPAWFQSFRKGKVRFDHTKKCSKPFEILPGGYIGAFEISAGTGWHQVHAPATAAEYSARPRPGSRRERRRTPRDQWLDSSISFTKK